MDSAQEKKIEVKALCLIVRGGKVLAFPGRDDMAHKDFYRLPGGGVEFGEISEQAIRREIREEFKSELENLVFIGIKEDLFIYKGRNKHQVIFLFKGDFVDVSLYAQPEICIKESHQEYHMVWVSAENVLDGSIVLYPSWNYRGLLR